MTSEKKRKRDSSLSSTHPIKVLTAEATDFPPIVATTHGITLPPSIPLRAYKRPLELPSSIPSKSSAGRHRSQEYLLHGTTPRIDYEGVEYPEDSEYQRFYVGIYDPEKNVVELHLAPKVHMGRSIRKHRERDVELEERGVVLSNADSRVALGKQFGTKKAQKLLESREMNKIDISEMDKSVQSSIITQVGETTKDMPTTAELGTQMVEARLIPVFNKEAERPEDVYKLEDVISKEEWEMIWVKEWEKGTVKTNSTYVKHHVQKLLQQETKNVKALKILKYISWMIDFYLYQAKSRGRVHGIDRVKKILGMDHVLVEGLFKRYTEKTTSGNEGDNKEMHTVPPSLANKLLYYMVVLCLMVDGYDVDLFELKQDLEVQPKELIMAFKEVGCSVRELTKTQYTAMKMTKAEAAQHRRAVLKIPLEFPNAPRRRATARR
ncbi:DNA-directed RNA polymerase I subunit rpa49 [Rhizina undulata]